MTLTPGASVGPYEIVGTLGAGGMGEVYRARDSRLSRDVAIKVLPQSFSRDPDLRARFEREAQTIASLSHPNILAIFDTGVHENQLFIVTELLEGETLRAHVGALPARKSIDIAVQIARGLAAAHDKGLVHRDLKPENIFVLSDGHVKILDFGLARQRRAAAGSIGSAVTGMPTSAGLTDPGTVLGTAGYMSPEQVRGEEVDHRSDIFAFGLVLYEMLSGRRAFQRDTAAETMTAILKEDPPELNESGLHISPNLDRIIRRCLEKQPRLRFQSAADLGFALEAATTSTTTAAAVTTETIPPSPQAPRRLNWVVAAATFALGFAIAVILILWVAGPPRPDSTSFRFTPFSFEAGGQSSAVWAQDGKAIAYQSSIDPLGSPQTFVRYLDSSAGKQLTHLKEPANPVAWSPDSRRIIFLSSHQPWGLWSVAVVGGEPESVMALDPAKDASSTVAAARDFSAVALLHRGDDGRLSLWVSTPVGTPLKQYSPDPFATQGILNRPFLAFSPDRKHILLFINSADRGREEAWLMPYPADPSSPPRLIFQDFPTWIGTPNFSWMPDSRNIIVTLQSEPGTAAQLFLADTIAGTRFALSSQTGRMTTPSVSPDGDRLIFSQPSGSFDIASVNLETAAAQRLMATERDEYMPAWSKNQTALVYVTDRNGPMEIWLHGSDGIDRPVVTGRDFPSQSTQWFMAPSLSPSGDRVVYGRIGHGDAAGSSSSHLWISSVSGGAPVPLSNDADSNEVPGSWSPDGGWFVYVAIRNGKADLMKIKTSGQAEPILVRAEWHPSNAAVPVWSPDGEWIEYNDKGETLISPDGKNVRSLGDLHSDGCTFSADSRVLYCLRWDQDHETLFSVDLSNSAQKVIGNLDREFRPRSSLSPAIRLSLAPDGKSIIYGNARSVLNNLWLLEGFAPKRGLLDRLHLRLR